MTAADGGPANHNSSNQMDRAGPRSGFYSNRPLPADTSGISTGILHLNAQDSVVSSLNAAASKHRARLLDRCVREVKNKSIESPDSKPAGLGSAGEHAIDDDLRELQEDCEFIQRTNTGRLAAMSLSLHSEFLNN